jgi:DNA-binding CsgD family transcriptional regulator
VHRDESGDRLGEPAVDTDDVWRGLARGRWSIVDHWDEGGQRFAIAVRRPAAVARLHALSSQERRVAALVATGQRDKEVAHALGLTISTVVATLARVRKKLAVRTRTDLAVLWRAHAW